MSASEILFYNAGSHLNMFPRPCDVFYIRQMIVATSWCLERDVFCSTRYATKAHQDLMCYGQIACRQRHQVVAAALRQKVTWSEFTLVSLSPAAPLVFPRKNAFQLWSQNETRLLSSIDSLFYFIFPHLLHSSWIKIKKTQTQASDPWIHHQIFCFNDS